MKHFLKASTSLAAGALAFGVAFSAEVQAAPHVAPELGNAVPKFLVKPPSAYVQARVQSMMAPGAHASGLSTIPFWSATLTSPLDNKTYTYSMVGGSPYGATLGNTNISYVPVVLRIHVKSGGVSYVIDPTQTSHCDTQSASYRFFNSPLFKGLSSFTSNGVQVVGTAPQQLLSAYQRANFWSAVQGTNYGVTLVSTRSSPIVVDWTPHSYSPRAVILNDDCGKTFPIAEVDVNELDTELQSIGRTYATATQIPVTLVADTAIYQRTYSNCCILGFHNAVALGSGVQVYAVGAYFTQSTVFGPHFADTTVWSHEMGELFDDPFVQSISAVPGGVNNALTPAWGNTGQVTGCQNNLENGDPLTPDQNGNFPNYAVSGYGGFTYHYQDLAFHDWFYRTASTGTGGKYSLTGNFTSGQAACV